MRNFHFIELSNGKSVQTMYMADENEVEDSVMGENVHFDFKELTNGEYSKKIVVVNKNGNQINPDA